MEIQIRNLDLVDLPSLDGKFLVVETMSDGYTGTVEGRYNYDVEVKNGEYFIYPTHWDILRNQFVREPALVVYTDQNVVYFSANVNKDPYTPTDIKKLIVYDYMEKDKRVVQAFKIFANEAFSMGNYNLFLKDVIVKDNPAVKRVKGISLNPASLALSVGSKKTLLPVFDPVDASIKTATWKSDKPAIAFVNDKGEVTGKTNGTANIEVKSDDGDFTATAKATVTTAVTGVTLDKTNLALKVGDTGQLTATVAPAGASNKAVTYSSNATNVATVDNTGKVTAVANGSATITVKTTDGAKTAVCSVSVTTAVTGVSLDKTTTNVTVGDTTKLTATVVPATASNKTVAFTSSDETIATVDSSGNVKGIKAGSADITVKTAEGAKTAVCKVTVAAATVAVTGVSLDKTTLSVEEGETATVSATVAPSNATNKGVSWKSGADATATVTASGSTATIKGVKAGTCNVVVTTADGSKTATVAITVTAKTEEPAPKG